MKQGVFTVWYRPAVDPLPDFQGDTYEREHDHERLSKQLRRVYDLMADGRWRTLEEIAAATGDNVASISARLRDLRKPALGAYGVDRRARGDRAAGLYEYRLSI